MIDQIHEKRRRRRHEGTVITSYSIHYTKLYEPTLPLIHALHNGNAEQRTLLRKAIERGGLEQIDGVVAAIEATGSLAYTARRAEHESELARQALAAIPESPYKQALLELAYFSVHRDY